MNKRYTVKNIRNDDRRFWDGHLGQFVVLQPKQSCVTTYPPDVPEIFEVNEYVPEQPKKEEEKPKKKVLKPKKEEIKEAE